MATGAGVRQISLLSLSLSSRAVVDQHTRPQVHARLHFTYTLKFSDQENPLFGARIREVSSIQAELWQIFC